jgi:phage replication initiation protein
MDEKQDSYYRGSSNTPVVCTDRTPGPVQPLRILIDWLGFTFNTDSVNVYEVLDFFEGYLGIDREAFKPGRRNYEGYADSLLFENINIYYNGAVNQGIHVDITGQGCRFLDFYYQKLRVHDQNSLTKQQKFRVHRWRDFLELLFLDERIKFTRLDLACDDLYGYLDIMHIFQKCLAGEFTMKFRSWTPYGKFDSDGKSNGLTLYFGSDKSDIQCTFYEKNKQLGLDYHWTRVELRFMQKRANEMVTQILYSDHMDIGVHFAGVLKNYLTFRIKNENDSNKRRWDPAPWWENFLRGVPRLLQSQE